MQFQVNAREALKLLYKSALNSLFGALKFVFNHRGFFLLSFQNAILNKLLFNNNGFYVKFYFL